MADTVDSVVIFSGTRKRVVRLINISDGTGESSVVKLDKSTFVGPNGLEPSKMTIEWIQWAIQGFSSIKLYFDHVTDDEAAVLTGSGYFDYREVGGLKDPSSTGGTGDVILTTVGPVAGASYDITIAVRFKD